MGDEQNRFKKLEFKKGRFLTPDDISVEKSKKFKLLQLERRLTIDKTIESVLSTEQQNTQQLKKNIRIFSVASSALALIFLLAAHRLFGFDSLLANTLKILVFIVLPFAVIRWVLSKE